MDNLVCYFIVRGEYKDGSLCVSAFDSKYDALCRCSDLELKHDVTHVCLYQCFGQLIKSVEISEIDV